jgi:DNA invertase Pin-like site-specific DNA recombinase
MRDSCIRNTLEFLKLQEELFKKKVTFLSLDLPYSTDIAVNKLIATNLAGIATFENERAKDVQDLKENKNLSITQIAKGRNTI